jgi:hypothetical protein
MALPSAHAWFNFHAVVCKIVRLFARLPRHIPRPRNIHSLIRKLLGAFTILSDDVVAVFGMAF